MITLQRKKRGPRDVKAHLEYLDERIVPSTLQPNLMTAEVAITHASVNSAQPDEEAAPAESKIEIRCENRMIRIAERREKVLERREKVTYAGRLVWRDSPRLTSFLRLSSWRARARALAVTNTSSGTASSPSSGTATTNSISPTAPATTSPVTTVPPTPLPVATTPEPTTPATTSPVLPLPANVSALLDTVYEEFESGDLPSTNQPGQVEIQGNNVGIQIRGDATDFASVVANAESLGLQVTTESSAYDIVVGFLPIANLPAAAQLAGTPSITPIVSPRLN